MQFSIDLLMQFHQTFYEVFKTYISAVLSNNFTQFKSKFH